MYLAAEDGLSLGPLRAGALWLAELACLVGCLLPVCLDFHSFHELVALVVRKDLLIFIDRFRGYDIHPMANRDEFCIAVTALGLGVGKASDGFALDVPLHCKFAGEHRVQTPSAIDALDVRCQPLLKT